MHLVHTSPDCETFGLILHALSSVDISVTARGLGRLSLQILCDKTDHTNLPDSHAKKQGYEWCLPDTLIEGSGP